jgi:hypothetical protein
MKTKWKVTLWISSPAVFAVLGLGMLRVHYRLTHWPALIHPEAIVEFADHEFKRDDCDREIPFEQWPEEIQRLSPGRVRVTPEGLDIVLHAGGAFRGNTGFWVLREGQDIPDPRPRDVIVKSGIRRIVKYDLYD